MRVVRFILFVLACVCLIWILVFLLSRMLTGSSAKPKIPDAPLSSTYPDSTAELYIDGPVQGADQHRAVRITVNKNQSRIQKIHGYSNVVDDRAYPSSEKAYGVFLKALDDSGFTKGDNSSANRDESGICPTGNRFVFRLSNNGRDTLRYWKTTCGSGTYAGKTSQTIWLFTNQIPSNDFNDLTGDISTSI